MHSYANFQVEGLINVFNSFTDSEFAPLITHALDVAKLSAGIAERVGGGRLDKRAVYIAGLLHDWGLFVRNAVKDPGRLALSLGDSVFPTKDETRSFDFGSLLDRLESDNLNRHAEISSSILRYIELPEPYAKAIAAHHRPIDELADDDETVLLASVFKTADEMSRIYRKALAEGRTAAYHALYDLIQSDGVPEALRPGAKDLLLDVIDMNYCLDLSPHADRYFGSSEVDLPRFIKFVETLSFTQDYRSPFTRNHSFSIATLAHDLALEALSERDALELKLAGLIHDFGKITIPLDILHKPAALIPCEMEIMKGHVVESFKMIDPIIRSKDIVLDAVYHHERLDGSGYPMGLAAPDLTMRARIVQVCDNYVALVEERPYRRALPPAEAIVIIEDEVRAGRLDGEVFELLRTFVRNGYQTGEYRELLHVFLGDRQ
ncbi:MAG TPA: HD domain-containing phosphohydrolase [Rectinemataceae bacterium]|nr:HD domain-containing phosphohydrolase [Rectinemataceae bacterium]